MKWLFVALLIGVPPLQEEFVKKETPASEIIEFLDKEPSSSFVVLPAAVPVPETEKAVPSSLSVDALLLLDIRDQLEDLRRAQQRVLLQSLTYREPVRESSVLPSIDTFWWMRDDPEVVVVAVPVIEQCDESTLLFRKSCRD